MNPPAGAGGGFPWLGAARLVMSRMALLLSSKAVEPPGMCCGFLECGGAAGGGDVG
jgi:hypothetical protein